MNVVAAAVAASHRLPSMLLEASSTSIMLRSTVPASIVSAVASTVSPLTETETESRSAAPGRPSVANRAVTVPSSSVWTWSMLVPSAAWAGAKGRAKRAATVRVAALRSALIRTLRW